MYKNKTIWIIGASSGIGRELAFQLAGKGARLILSSRRESELQELKKELNYSDKHVVFPLDLENLFELNERLTELMETVKTIDFLFNNGGMSQRGTARETSMDVDRRIMEVNYFGNIKIAKAVLPIMIKNGGGHIVVISSIAGKFGFYLRSAYSAAKHALHGFYESLRLEEEKNNIRVTIVCPGKINTPISTNALTAEGKKHGVMDHNQETGMDVGLCVQTMLKEVAALKKEVYIGGREIKAVTIKRLFPSIFYSIIKRQSAT
ncbi:MAG: SDR family oxidoreductase [Crocinitomicaceae bacterium]|jgi:short-subunit dehydrogenase|nr:SDR family oxidoreductase [Crocinitomicaceae bacterium]